MKRLYKDRLRKLAKFLQKVKPDKFDISSFVRYYEGEGPIYTKKDGFCGTAACAIGYCPVVFPRSFEYDGMSGVNLKKYDSINNWQAAHEFFGLRHAQATYLFSGDEYEDAWEVKPKTVAARILQFVKDDGAYNVNKD